MKAIKVIIISIFCGLFMTVVAAILVRLFE